MTEEQLLGSAKAWLVAITALLADARGQDLPAGAAPTEELLARAGLNATDIAAVVGKQPGAVRTTLSRSRARKAKGAGR